MVKMSKKVGIWNPSGIDWRVYRIIVKDLRE